MKEEVKLHALEGGLPGKVVFFYRVPVNWLIIFGERKELMSTRKMEPKE